MGPAVAGEIKGSVFCLLGQVCCLFWGYGGASPGDACQRQCGICGMISKLSGKLDGMSNGILGRVSSGDSC
jgi:hypothetical protein